MSAAYQATQPAASPEPTREDCARMARDGYLVVREFFGAEETRDILRCTWEIQFAPELSGWHWVHHEHNLTEPGRRDETAQNLMSPTLLA